MNALPPVSVVTDHARERARERYGVWLHPMDLDAIKGMCGRQTIVRTQSNGAVHMIKFRGIVMVPVIRGDAIITFLPHKALTNKATKEGRLRAYRSRRGDIRGRRPQ